VDTAALLDRLDRTDVVVVAGHKDATDTKSLAGDLERQSKNRDPRHHVECWLYQWNSTRRVVLACSATLLRSCRDGTTGLLGCFNQRLDAGRGVVIVGILHRHPDDRARLKVDGMLGLGGPSACARPSSW
jgi:hypothetical protein